MESEIFSPKIFLKSRRPERFSDSVLDEVTELDRSLLEFHLSSLTSRGQETDFERFAHHLCQREICPNLLPQTGPTGGGDSKVDSETYPVADKLALIWYEGIGREAANERWAFAFSAKARWIPKVKSDIKKIAETSRDYKKAFFVTNQAVRDKKRAEVEDSLRNEHNIDVRILDRTWILDRVFEGRHEELAIEELKVTGLTHRIVSKGPRDIKREDELDALERQIEARVQKGRINANLVDDVLNAADLARNLERPRAEIEGRFNRANQLAQNYGSLRQKVEAAYQWAWTLFWWFEDYDSFAEQYELVEGLTSGSRNAYDLERLTSLWYCLFSTDRHNLIEIDSSALQTKTDILLRELTRLMAEEERPSTALQAETNYIQIQLLLRRVEEKSVDDLLEALCKVVQKSSVLIGFPLEPLVEALTEIGPVLEGSATYEKLFEKILEVVSTRDGEVRAARILLTRGDQQINLNLYVEAIVTLGRSLRLLYKYETRHDIVEALYLCGCAYDELGLLWAARGTLLSAASIATNDFWQYGEITPYQASCYQRLKWIELFLGRLPHILLWHELDRIVRHALIDRGYDQERLLSNESDFEMLLGRLLLRVEYFDLKFLVAMPTILDELGLDLASDTLLYVLGHKERLEETCQNLNIDPLIFASQWWNAKSDRSLPNSPKLYNRQKVVLRSRILGCEIVVTCQNKPPFVELAESFLAAVESLLATITFNRAVAREPKLTVDIKASEFSKSLINFDIDDQDGRPHLTIYSRPFDPHQTNQEAETQIRKILAEMTTTVMSRIIFFKDLDRDMKTLFHDEKVIERAIYFTGTFRTQANVLGNSPKNRLSIWTDGVTPTYPLLQTEPWRPIEMTINDEEELESTLITYQENPLDTLDPNLWKHDQIELYSLIRERLWDQASWNAITFFYNEIENHPPYLALVFNDTESGRKIFVQWQKELGEEDIQNQLRLTILRGIDKSQPYAYRVMIGSNPESLPSNNKLQLFMARTQEMDANTPDNLNKFLESYSRVGVFYLAPAFMSLKDFRTEIPVIDTKLRIQINSLNVRNAWEVSLGDVDSFGIKKEDNPIIPKGTKKPPVKKLLKYLRKPNK